MSWGKYCQEQSGQLVWQEILCTLKQAVETILYFLNEIFE
jgi:hypothetical protein